MYLYVGVSGLTGALLLLVRDEASVCGVSGGARLETGGEAGSGRSSPDTSLTPGRAGGISSVGLPSSVAGIGSGLVGT